MLKHAVDDLSSPGSVFYRDAFDRLKRAQIPFLVGGAYALQVHTGIVRRTKDLDLFLLKDDALRALEVFAAAGYNTELTFPHWLGKAFAGEDFIDLIFSSGNGVCPVDEQWFQFSARGTVLGIDVRLCPAEETIWQKAFILERDRCDVADVAHLLRHCGQRLDWSRTLQRFADHWPVLLAQLLLFRFIYPGHQGAVPDWVMGDLLAKCGQQRGAQPPLDLCYGTLISATQFLHDVELEGFRDGRLQPLGNMSKEDLALWTANFMKPC